MHLNTQVLLRALPLVTGVAMTITVALGFAAVVMWVPESPLETITGIPVGPAFQTQAGQSQPQSRNSALPALIETQRETFAY